MAVSCIIQMVAFHPMTEVTGVPGKHNTRKGPAFLKKAGTPEVNRTMLSEKKVD